jgi:hypothetical protein
VKTVNLSKEQVERAISMLKNARNILGGEGYFYAEEIDEFLKTIPCQAADVAVDRTVRDAEGVETRP